MASSFHGLYEDLGVRPVINAQGNRTVIGGSQLSKAVEEARIEANERYVEMRELLEKSGEYIADLLGTEAAYVTSGGCGALALSAAACITGDDLKKITRLPDTSGMKNEIVIQKKQRYGYDRCYLAAGARVVEAGDEKGCTKDQLEAAIGPSTAAVAHLVRSPLDRDSSELSLEEMVALAHRHNVPVISDAASHIYPLDHFLKSAQGADLVCFGAKYLGGPSSTGIVCGKKELVEAAVAHGYIGYYTSKSAIGRAMKVDRQDVISVVVALKLWFSMNHEDRLIANDEKLSVIQRGLGGISNVKTEMVDEGHYWGSSLHVVIDTSALGKNAEQLAKELEEGDPSIWVRTQGEDTIRISPHTLNEGEDRIIAETLKSVLIR